MMIVEVFFGPKPLTIKFVLEEIEIYYQVVRFKQFKDCGIVIDKWNYKRFHARPRPLVNSKEWLSLVS